MYLHPQSSGFCCGPSGFSSFLGARNSLCDCLVYLLFFPSLIKILDTHDFKGRSLIGFGGFDLWSARSIIMVVGCREERCLVHSSQEAEQGNSTRKEGTRVQLYSLLRHNQNCALIIPQVTIKAIKLTIQLNCHT